MVDLLSAMGQVLGTWLIVGVALVGIGLFVGWALGGGREQRGVPVHLAFWLGYGGCVLVLQVWHLMRPVDGWALGFVLAIGWLAVIWRRRMVGGVVRRLARHRWLAVSIAAAGLWIANQAIGPGDDHDSGSYHYAIILWNHGWSIVPGLGNLSPMYAINNSSLLYASMLNVGPWSNAVGHVCNGLLV